MSVTSLERPAGLLGRARIPCEPLPGLLGLILLVAAGAKFYQRMTDPVPPSSWLERPEVEGAVVGFEVAFALFLWSGLYPRGARWAGGVVFAGLAAVSLAKGWQGEESCGCFGKVTVSPWAMALIDAGAVFGLVEWRPGLGRGCRAVFAVGLITGLASGTVVGVVAARQAAVVATGRVVRLSPEEWVGSPPPLSAGDVEGLPDGFGYGHRRLVFVQSGCPACEELIRGYLTSQLIDPSDPPFLFVQIPNEQGTHRPGGVWARLTPRKTWFVRTPTVVELENGVVARVHRH